MVTNRVWRTFHTDDISEGSRIIVFGTDDSLSRLCASDIVLMDGTFKVCPRVFYQLYVIHSHMCGTVLPELFCLLPDKKAATYHRLLSLPITKCAERGYCFKPATIIVDFQLAVHNVVRTLFPASSLKGCLFHFGQALWKKLQELGLSAKYGKEDNGVSKWFRLFIGTAFVPPPQAMTAYQLITSTHTHTHLMIADVSSRVLHEHLALRKLSDCHVESIPK